MAVHHRPRRSCCPPVLPWAIVVLTVLAPAGMAVAAWSAEVPAQIAERMARFEQPLRLDLVALIARLEAAGWSLQVVADDGIPWSLASLAGGVHMHLAEGQEQVELWALPPDWAGIRTPVIPGQPYTCLWVHALASMRLLITGDGPSERLLGLLDPSGGPVHQPGSLWQHRIPAIATPAQASAAAIAARAVLDRFCANDGERDRGIMSLIECDVPAFALYLDLARHGSLSNRTSGVMALAALHTPAGAHALCAMLTPDPGDEDGKDLRHTILDLLYIIADPAWLPDLRMVLATSEDGLILGTVTRVLGILRCAEAAPRILELMRKEADPDQLPGYVQALARLGCREVLPVIVDHLDRIDLTGQDLGVEHIDADLLCYRESFLALTAHWSGIADHARILLLPQAPAVPLGSDCAVALVIQAVDQQIDSIDYEAGVLTVDGVDHATTQSAAVGYFGIDPGNLSQLTLDLGQYITAPGTHQVGFRCHGMVAQPIAIAVAAP